MSTRTEYEQRLLDEYGDFDIIKELSIQTEYRVEGKAGIGGTIGVWKASTRSWMLLKDGTTLWLD